MIACSVYIISQNEEKNIQRVLESVCEFDEVILVDSGSTDQTLTIASNYKNVKIFKQPWLGYAKQKQYAKSLCSHQWVLTLDCDHQVSEALKEEIKKITNTDVDFNAVYAPIIDQYLFFRKYHRWTRFPKRLIFFKKDEGHYKDVLIHEGIEIQGKKKNINAPLYHHYNLSIEDSINKKNTYSSLKALDKLRKGKKYSIIKLIIIFPLMFLKQYIFRRYFLSGACGLIVSFYHAQYYFLTEAKLFVAYRQKIIDKHK